MSIPHWSGLPNQPEVSLRVTSSVTNRGRRKPFEPLELTSDPVIEPVDRETDSCDYQGYPPYALSFFYTRNDSV